MVLEPAAVVYHKEGMTARQGSPTREFYLSRARMLFARRNLRGIGKYLSCAYLCILAAPKRRPCTCCTDRSRRPKPRYAAPAKDI